MNHDIRMTGEQLAELGEWVQTGPATAAVELADNAGTITARQGDDDVHIRPDGDEDYGCQQCGMPESVHASGDREYAHTYVANLSPDELAQAAEDLEDDLREEPTYCDSCGQDVNYEGHDSDCEKVLAMQRAAAQSDPRGERDR
jgi:hypothetical protein